MLDYVLIGHDSRSVPTHDHILVPETLLKKRKSQEKARAEKSAEIEKKKKVGDSISPNLNNRRDAQPFEATRPMSMLLLQITIFRV